MIVLAPERADAAEVLPGFPAGIPVQRDRFRNWDGVVVTDPLWTCVPRTPDDVVAIANWAKGAGYTVRPRGYRHSWSPLTVEAGTRAATKVLLVDTTVGLTTMAMAGADRVRVQAGARMDTLLNYLGRNGAALAGVPAPGDVTVGGVLAVNGHGTGIRAAGEKRVPGQSMGTLSNLVTSLTAVVWDRKAGRYVAQVFGREHPDAKAFLTGLGRVFLLEVTLQVMPDFTVRCRCSTDIPVTELFAPPARAGARSLTALLDAHGRVGVIWYAFTKQAWVQTWTLAPSKPLLSRPTIGPYNFPFADNLPSSVSSLLHQVVSGQDALAPAFGAAVLSATTLGLVATGATDMWGPARNFQHFVKPTTLTVSAGSHAVVVRRADVQRVVAEFAAWFSAALDRYAAAGRYPVNSCVEIRVTGVDDPAEVVVRGAEAPALSAAQPVDGRPELDTVVWLDALTLPGTPHEFEFFAEMEAFVRRNYAGYGVARPEWAKRWATTAAGPWTDATVMTRDIPAAFPGWEWVRATFDRYDPARLFSNPLLDRLMPRR